jgi:dipeptidyl aminopeptidase/acylaminoacyl peptidase
VIAFAWGRLRCGAIVAGLAILGLEFDASARLSADALFRPPVLESVVLGPSGELLAAVGVDSGQHAVIVRRRDGGERVVALRSYHQIQGFSWVDDRNLLVQVDEGKRPQFYVVSISSGDAGLATEQTWIRVPGWPVAPVPNAVGELLWVSPRPSETVVFRVPLGDLTRTHSAPDPRHEVARVPGFVPRWIADRHGVLRAGLRIEPKRSSVFFELLYRASVEERWQRIHAAEVDSEDDRSGMRIPLGIAANDRDLIVASNEGRDTVALVEMDAQTGVLGSVLFSHPRSDVSRVIYNYAETELIAVEYEESGLRRYHHFDSFAGRYQEALELALPGLTVAITSTSRDGRYFCVLATGPRDPGTYYVLDTNAREAVPVGQLMPWIDPEDLTDTDALLVRVPNGREVDAFLTRPRDAAVAPPLVVLPHGGPLGVRDRRDFDPLVQFLAAAELAILQVNYRGSSGYGKAFLEAGRREWAEGIEDDIDAAVDRVVAEGLVDGKRICIAGASYGGYSALMSIVRNPKRYRCAASLAGPSDLPLLFESPDFADFEEGIRYLTEIVGDPKREYERLARISPVYRAAEITVPVLLAHGERDRRVDVEHYHRMRAMLTALGNPPDALAFPGVGHDLSQEAWAQFAHRLRAFLLRHLN